MMELQNHLAAEINHHASIAAVKATEAVHHAIEAGKLLLEVKATLPHGQFQAWIHANTKLSVRQSKRYMAVAQGEVVPIRELSRKYDTVTHLTSESDQYRANPSFIPAAGQCFASITDGVPVYVIEPSEVHPGFFFVSHCLDEDAGTWDYLRRPIRSDSVEDVLQRWGLAQPNQAQWHVVPSAGVAYALESLGVPPPERGW